MDNIFLPFLQLNLLMAVLAITEAVPVEEDAATDTFSPLDPFLAGSPLLTVVPDAGLLGRPGDKGEDGSVGSDCVTLLPC